MCIPQLILILSAIVVNQNAAVPEQVGYAGQWYHDGYIIHAHSHMSGHEFYTLRPGDEVTVLCRDGEVKVYEVSEVNALAFGHPTDPWMLRVNGEWVYITRAIREQAGRSDLMLATCWASEEGYGQTTGRLYILLKEVENGMDYTQHSRRPDTSGLYQSA